MLLRFNNIAELREYIQNTPENPVCKTTASKISGRADFFGTEDYDTADRLLLTGDDDNAAKLEQATAAICSRQGLENRRVRTYGYTGATVNITRYLNGEDKVFNTYRRQRIQNRVVSIAANITVDYTWSSEDITQTAALILSQIIAIEKAGVRVQLYIATPIGYDSGITGFFVCAKQAQESLNINTLAFLMLNAGYFRRIGFAVMERHPDIKNSSYYRSYGSPVPNAGKTREALQQSSISPDYVVTYYDVKGKTPEDVEKLFK